MREICLVAIGSARPVSIPVDPMPAHYVHITIAANVAFDLASMQKVTASVLGKLGCPSCHSGFVLTYDIERQFIANERLQVFGLATS